VMGEQLVAVTNTEDRYSGSRQSRIDVGTVQFVDAGWTA